MKFATALAACLFAALLPPTQLAGQATATSDVPRVFLDCQNTWCDFDFLRTEITFVDWVRDRRVAQIHLLVTSQQTGSGGREYTLDFVGQERFAGTDQRLRHVTLPTESDDEVRRGLARLMKLGLVRYAASTTLAGRLNITYDAPASSDTARPLLHDPWNYWVYRASINGNLNGESRSMRRHYRARFTANRTTADWKIRTAADGSYDAQQFVIAYDTTGDLLDDVTDTTRAYRHEYSTFGLVVRSLGEHWSVGGYGWASSSTYSNQKLTLQGGPALEYNVFPYSQFNQRQLTMRYVVRANRFLYNEETIYFLRRENRWDHLLEAELETNQKWGQAEISVEASQYFFDPSKRRLEINGYGEYRIFKGFAINAFAGYELVRDQLSLPRGGAAPNEVYLRLRELQTDYRYFTGFGLSYTFGSIFNSVVNPRFPGM